MVLCHVEGLDGPSAARRLRIPLGTLQSRLHRARLRLRRGLTRRGFAPAGVAGALAAVQAPARAEVPASLARSIARLAALGGSPPAGVEYLILGFSWRTVMKTKAAWIAGLSVGIAGLGGGLGLAHRGASAGDGPPAQVIAKPAGLSVGERIRAVLDEHVRSLQKQDASELVASLVTKRGASRPSPSVQDKTIETSRKLLDLIEQDPRDPESLRAMTWHVDQYWISGTEGPLIDQLTRSVDVLLRHYADEPRIAFRVLVRPSTLPTPLDDRLIPLLAASARRRETKGLAPDGPGRVPGGQGPDGAPRPGRRGPLPLRPRAGRRRGKAPCIARRTRRPSASPTPSPSSPRPRPSSPGSSPSSPT